MKIRKSKIIDGETYLHCSQCDLLKKVEEFYMDRKGKLGRKHWCKECTKKYAKKYAKKYRGKNPELYRQLCRQWRLNNPEKSKNAHHNWYRRTKNKMTRCLGIGVYKSLNKNFDGRKLWETLGYTYQEFIKHMEKHFQPGMTWENHGEWEIDHIIPISFFRYQSPEDVEFKMCWRLENIQPLWKHQNKQKSNRILIA